MNDFEPLPTVAPVTHPFLAPERTVVIKSERDCDDTVTLTVECPPGMRSWQPGQFNMLYLFGLGEVPISISGSLKDSGYLAHTVKAVGPVTTALTKLLPGDELWVRGPYGSAWPDVSGDRNLLLVAGGIGLAPLRPVILNRVQNPTAGSTILLYGTRTPADVLFPAELADWASRPNVTVHVTVDKEDATSHSQWHGSIGVVTHLLHHLQLDPSKTTVMTCGPEVMMRHVATDLASMGINNEQIFVSMERNMKCAVGLCGRCQWGAQFVCKDGPVYRLSDIRRFWSVKEF